MPNSRCAGEASAKGTGNAGRGDGGSLAPKGLADYRHHPSRMSRSCSGRRPSPARVARAPKDRLVCSSILSFRHEYLSCAVKNTDLVSSGGMQNVVRAVERVSSWIADIGDSALECT